MSAGDEARYVPCNDTDAFAAAASALLDDPAERRRMGAVGRERVAGELSWERSKGQLLASYAAATGRAPEPLAKETELAAPPERVPVRA